MKRCDKCAHLTDDRWQGLCRTCAMREMERKEREREAE